MAASNLAVPMLLKKGLFLMLLVLLKQPRAALWLIA